ncbi:kinase-like protein [Panus rudis PR-1116 ss-1]|nr:kinase-like protein [Panus rudis PR-1116 ss-1]
MAAVANALVSLARIAQELYEQVQTMKENKEQCRRLASHACVFYTMMSARYRGKVPSELEAKLVIFTQSLSDIKSIVEELKARSYLKRLVWASDISRRVARAYTILDEALQVFNFTSQMDVQIMLKESHEARAKDTATTEAVLQQLLRNDNTLLEHLQMQKSEMRDALVTLHKRIDQLPGSLEKEVYERGLHEIRRYSQESPVTPKPDAPVITSLDVVIRYDKKLGSGGFGTVYQGHWNGRTRVAVKVLDRTVPESAMWNEIDTWKSLQHPNILQFYGASPMSCPPFLVCELLKHGDILQYVRKYPNVNRRKLLLDAGEGLTYLHKKHIIHRDLKAANILIKDNGEACLSDFGLAEIKMHTTNYGITTSNSDKRGSARWMAPEQMLQGTTSRHSDIYSFGMTMYEVFTGLPPFSGVPDSLLLQIVVDRGRRPLRPERPSDCPGLDDKVWTLMESMWDAKPKQRPNIAHVCDVLGRGNGLMVHFGETEPPRKAHRDKLLSKETRTKTTHKGGDEVTPTYLVNSLLRTDIKTKSSRKEHHHDDSKLFVSTEKTHDNGDGLSGTSHKIHLKTFKSHQYLSVHETRSVTSTIRTVSRS